MGLFMGRMSWTKAQIFRLFFVNLTRSQSTSAQTPIISKNLCGIQRIYPKFKEFWGYPGRKSMKYIISEDLGGLRRYREISKG
ncbi:unnamed protein product [Meloidogyne enterolobii]|uniref:Uncharacterized protein n=1 Tax=Meloidogyne enterolobii TaxID=390850 RepID=A0ACB1ADQ7_MELEN